MSESMMNEVPLRAALGQADAIMALEGFSPDEISQAVDHAVLSGKTDLTQANEALLQYVQENKTVTGFLDSGLWRDLVQ